jgi:hypothetical protein
MTESASKVADDNLGMITFNDVLYVLQQTEKSYELPFEGSDPKVLEFLQILEEYRVKCEEEGNYLEAARAYRQLGVLRKQEEKRQQKAIHARQISEKQDVQLAHNMQFNEFNKSWDKYLEDYDSMAQTYIQQMTERHAVVLLEFQKQLRQDLASKPPKWSKELLDQRRKQHINARNKNYTLAQKLKKMSDKTEERERREMEQAQAVIFGRREAKFRMQQQTELQALLKRIECRRKEHIKQRNLDTKRLLQRNRNVQAVLDSKQATECQKLFADIKKTLYSTAALHGGQATSVHTNTQRGGKTSQKSTGAKTQAFGAAMAASQAHYDQVAQEQFLKHQQQAQQHQQHQQQYQSEQFYQQQRQPQDVSPEGARYYQSESKHPEEQYYTQASHSHSQSQSLQQDSGVRAGGRYDQEDEENDAYADLDEENDAAILMAHAPKPQPDPAFMNQPGPNFTNLVYAPGESYEDESLDEGLVYE